MRQLFSPAAVPLTSVLLGSGTACAQTEKTIQRAEMNGQATETPYITYRQFRSVVVRSPNGQLPLRKILTVSSLEEVTRLLGELQATARNDDPDDASYTTWLDYSENVTVKYHGFPDGTLGLTSIELRSSRWGLKIGDKELSPGTDVASLDAAVRQTAVPENHSKKADVSGMGLYTSQSRTR